MGKEVRIIILLYFFLTSLFLELYHRLEPFFHLDPLLLPQFIFTCPMKEYQQLFLILHPFFSISRMALISRFESYMNNEDVSHFITTSVLLLFYNADQNNICSYLPKNYIYWSWVRLLWYKLNILFLYVIVF